MDADNKSVFNVFIATGETMRPGLIIRRWGASDVFCTLDEAVSAGIKALHNRFNELKEFFGEDWDEDDIADKADYRFTVFEYDPRVARNEDGWWEQFTEWTFSHKGVLRERTEHRTVRNGSDVEQYSTVRFPGDDAEEAGSKFSVGEFVTIADDEENRIYVVSYAPGSRENWPKKFVIASSSPYMGQPESGENYYTVDGFDSIGLYTHKHPHETQMRLYEGEVPDKHPLQLLRRHSRGEISISDDVFDDIFYGRIIFDYPPELRSWREIPELISIVTPEGSKEA